MITLPGNEDVAGRFCFSLESVIHSHSLSFVLVWMIDNLLMAPTERFELRLVAVYLTLAIKASYPSGLNESL